MVRAIFLALMVTSAAAEAQESLSPDTGPDPTTCGQFIEMDPAAQLNLLSTMEPFGDDMEPADLAASEQWTATVAGACKGHPDRPLVDAAREAIND